MIFALPLLKLEANFTKRNNLPNSNHKNQFHFHLITSIRTSLDKKNSGAADAKLVVGGPENNNAHVDGYSETIKDLLQKVVALKDVVFSNSPVEALNKVLKNNYLNKMIRRGEPTKRHS